MAHKHGQSEEASHSAGDHDHSDDHDHRHDHDHQRDDDRHAGLLARLRDAIPFLHGHSHGPAEADRALETSERGIWALKVSLVGLAATAAFQLVIVAISGSVALFADTIHNFADALTAVPLWIAFVLGRRAANRRYTYGYGRAEDLAGVAIVGIIFLTALLAAYESARRLFDPRPLDSIGWVIAAAVIGFIGNEAVAVLRIRVGREIGSAALVADGQHARVDGITSLAVLGGALGVLAGFPIADPIVGLLITVAILFIVKDTAVTMWRRMMDAVDPELVDGIERSAGTVAGVHGVEGVRVRWVGHRLHAELHVRVDEELPTRASHGVAEEVRHALFHAQPRLSVVTVHVDPCGHGGADPHTVTAHHDHLAPATTAST